MPGTAAFRPTQDVGFPLLPGLSADHNYTFFGAQCRPCTLVPSGSRLPSWGLPADFSTDLPDQLWSGGTFATHTALHPGTPSAGIHASVRLTLANTHWVTLSNFKDLSYSDDSDLARHEGGVVMCLIFRLVFYQTGSPERSDFFNTISSKLYSLSSASTC